MPTWRVVWEFIESNGSSFNEIFYKDADQISSAVEVPQTLINARLPMLHYLNTLLRVRVSNTQALRQTGTKPINLVGTYGGQSPPLPVGDACVLALASNAGGSRKLWMRGLPDIYQARDNKSGQDAPQGPLLKLLDTYYNELSKAGYGIRRLTPPAPGPLANVKITQVDGTAKNGTSVLTFQQAPGYAVPGQIVIGGASKKDLPGLNGVFSLIAVNGALVTIPYQTPGGLVVTTTTAHARQAVYQATAVFTPSLCAFDHFGTRTSKNPLSRSRGARRAARLRSSL